MFGYGAEACLMSAFICTRQGSPRLHWLIPMMNGSSGVPACFLGPLLDEEEHEGTAASATRTAAARTKARRCVVGMAEPTYTRRARRGTPATMVSAAALNDVIAVMPR